MTSAGPRNRRIALEERIPVSAAPLLAPLAAGVLTAPLGAGPLDMWDRGSVLEVGLSSGVLSTATELAVYNGANAAAVESAFGWEILQWRDAEDLGGGLWRLSALLRGRGRTEAHLNHVAGAAFRAFQADMSECADGWSAGIGGFGWTPPDPLAAAGADPLGEPMLWTERFERWADLRPEAQREAVQGQALVASGFWRCELLHDPETAAVIPERWRVRHDGASYNIRSALDPDGRRRVLVMTLEKEVAT